MSNFSDKPRMSDPRGIAIAGAAHVAIGWMVLNMAGVAPGPISIPQPVKVIDVPDERPERKPEPPPPLPRDDIQARVDAPTIDIETPPIDLPAEPLRPQPDLSADLILPDWRPRGDLPALAPPENAPAQPEPALVEARLDPRFLARFQPPYPSASRRLEEEGRVVVEVLVGADGRVQNASLARSSGYERLDRAALAQAERRWRFRPATRGGTPVESTKRVSVSFELQGG